MRLQGQIYGIEGDIGSMKNEKIVKYSDIGQVLYRKNPRARNLSIRISGKGEVRVTVPRFCTFHSAESFVLKKRDWIKKKALSIERRNSEKRVWREGSVLQILYGSIVIEKGEGKNLDARKNDEDWHISLPIGFDTHSEESQYYLSQVIADIGLMEAKLHLPKILDSISTNFSLPYRKVSMRKMKSRWGSCSPENNISLNSALIFLPYNLIEYVLLHELVHTVHKNHGRNFWAMLESMMPDAIVKRKELNKHEMM